MGECHDGARNVWGGFPDRLVVLIRFGGTLQVAVGDVSFVCFATVSSVQFHPSPIISKSP